MAKILGFSNRQIAGMMEEILEFAGIGDHIDAPIKHYSSGMYVRLGFAVAVMVRPEILIVDEVIAVGDEEFQRKCYDHLRELRRGGTTMLIVSHGLDQVVNLCDEAIWLDRGEIVGKGDAAMIVRDYLDSVNRSEAESAEAPPPETSIPPDDSSGGGRVPMKVTGVEFLGEDRSPQSLLLSGIPPPFASSTGPRCPLRAAPSRSHLTIVSVER